METPYSSAINPYALAEQIAGKTIVWDKVQEPKKLLSEILQLDEEVIFDTKYPLLTPTHQIEPDGKVKTLSEEESKKRLEAFLSGYKSRSYKKLTKEGVSKFTEAIIGKPELSEIVKPQKPDIIGNLVILDRVVTWDTNLVWRDKGDYFEDVAEVTDPIQGSLGNCYLIAALAAVAWSRPYSILNATRPMSFNDVSNLYHKIVFFDNNNQPVNIEVTELVPVAKNTYNWNFAKSLDDGEIWPAVMEKAYAKWRTNCNTDYPDYRPTAGGDPIGASRQLIGGTTEYKVAQQISVAQAASFLIANCVGNRTVNPMTATTYGSNPPGRTYSGTGIVGSHAYTILGHEVFNGENYIVLRNPWGGHPGTLDTRPGTWTANMQSFTASVPLNANGVFSMKLSTFLNYYEWLGVAK